MGASLFQSRMLGIVLILSAIVLGAALGALKANTDAQGLALCQYYTEENLDMSQCPAHNEAVSWYFITAFGVSFIAFGMGVYFVLTGGKEKNTLQHEALEPEAVALKPSFDASLLESDEQAVWQKMVDAHGSLFQSDLIRSTGFSKVKLSRVLDKLESKGAIERKRRGMTNLVVVK
ncbi:MAG: hypothetical protein HY393_02075 [Candidatus Diapherotrites archaeon]|nr:hypothetical protein [Candidatus Diapherotrites archaeon]